MHLCKTAAFMQSSEAIGWVKLENHGGGVELLFYILSLTVFCYINEESGRIFSYILLRRINWRSDNGASVV